MTPGNDGGNNLDGADFDSAVAKRMRPLAEAPTPDIWADVAAKVDESEVAIALSSGQQARHFRPFAMAAAAAILVIGASVVAAYLTQGRETQIDATTEADLEPQPSESTIPGEGDNTNDGESADDSISLFPDGVDIGPDRRAMSSIPFNAFEVVYDAGTVIIGPGGEIQGHYPGDIPTYVPSRDDLTTPDIGGVPDGCELDAILGNGQLRVTCTGEEGPTVEVVDDEGSRATIASFPLRPDSMPDEAAVHGFIDRTFPNEQPGRGGPILVQWIAECEVPMAMMVDAAFSTDQNPRGGSIRHMDGARYWQGPWPDGASVALGWAEDGSEAYVWRFSSGCSTNVERPGVYAYRLDGSSRLLFPTDADVRDVFYISTPGDDSRLIADVVAAEKSELWKQWAGPLEDPVAGGLDLEFDKGLIGDFLNSEPGFLASETELLLTATDPPSWIATYNDTSIRLTPSVFFGGTPDDGAEAGWTVRQADTFWGDDGAELSVAVHDRLGPWIAVVVVPGHGAAVTGSYSLAGETLEPRITELSDGTVELYFELDGEPTEEATLTVTWTRDGELVGFQRNVLPPGSQAAG